MKKIIAVISAMIIVLTLAACNRTRNGEVTTTLPETTAEEVTTAPVTEESTTVPETTEALTTEATTEETTATTTNTTTTKPTTTKPTTTKPTTTKPTTTKKATTTAKPTTEKKVTAPSGKADIVKLYDNAAAKAASSKPGYKKSTVTTLSNVKMGALSKISVVRGAVGDFLGEGSSNATVNKGKFDGKSLVKSTLKASDVKSATCKLSDDGKYYIVTINVVTETNPKKSGSALGKFTKDFKDVDEIKAGLADVGASVESMTVSTTSVTVNAKIRTDNNRFSSLNHTINMKANLKGVKYSIVRGVNASADMETKVSYTDFKY